MGVSLSFSLVKTKGIFRRMGNLGPIVLTLIDLVWLPIAWQVATKRQRPHALFFVALCIVTLHLQVGLVYSTGHRGGFTPWWQADVRPRGLVVYGIFTALYLLTLPYARQKSWPVLLSTALVVYMSAAIMAMLLMAV